MALYLGDIAEDATIAFTWATNDGNGASITRATDGTIKVRRHDDGTDCTGGSVTDSEDTPDTGLHECKIDTNDNANFTPGNDYTVWLDGAVIDGQTVNAVLATFSIENRYQQLTGSQMKDILAYCRGNVTEAPADSLAYKDADTGSTRFTSAIAGAAGARTRTVS